MSFRVKEEMTCHQTVIIIKGLIKLRNLAYPYKSLDTSKPNFGTFVVVSCGMGSL